MYVNELLIQDNIYGRESDFQWLSKLILQWAWRLFILLL